MSKILARDDPDRRCRPIPEWPTVDQQGWLAALEPGDVIDPGGLRAHHAAISNRNVSRSYGRWLQWLDRHGWLDSAEAPGDRVTPERVRSYVDSLRQLNNASTILERIQNLHAALRAIAPERDWSWICHIMADLRARRRARPKQHRTFRTDQLYALGQRLMRAAEDLATAWAQAIRYRDGLQIAFLAARPLRLKNFARLNIGKTLVRRGPVWWIDIPGEDTKSRREPGVMPLSDELSIAVDVYLRVHRPVLEARRTRCWRAPGNALWISTHGSPMSESTIYTRFVELTRTHLGRSVNPHLFRHCAATTVAIHDPDHIRIVAPLLGHRKLATSERYYNQARTREAAMRWQEHLIALRRS
jgi:site-specific recombinase XerD